MSQQLNKIQIQERAKRKRQRVVQMFGMPTRPGTGPRKSAATGKASYIPMESAWTFEQFFTNLQFGRLGRFLRPQRTPEGQVLPQQEREK